MSDGIDIGGGVTLKSKEKGTGIQVQAIGGDVGAGSTYSPWVEDIPGAPPVTTRVHRLPIPVTPTISTLIYAAGDNAGGILTFANAARTTGGTGTVRALRVVEFTDTPNKAALELVLFSASPAGTVTDQAPFQPSDAGMASWVGSIPIVATTGWNEYVDNAAALVACDIPYECVGGTSLFGALVVRGTPTYASAAGLLIVPVVSLD